MINQLQRKSILSSGDFIDPLYDKEDLGPQSVPIIDGFRFLFFARCID